MRAGQLRHRVTFQRPGGTIDAVGERQTTWTNVATVWAFVEPIATREQFIAAQANSFSTHRVKTRYCSEISEVDASWRLLFGSRIFVLEGNPINKDERNKEYEILCVESKRVE
jgi:SPP1 family predicted phage head-tail adaptor